MTLNCHYHLTMLIWYFTLCSIIFYRAAWNADAV